MKPDLNLLKLFLILFDERSVSAAAARVNLTQPAVSHALNRLREALEDPLFTRSIRGLQPTIYATEIEPRLRIALRDMMAAIERPVFDPATSDRQFNISAGPYLCELLMPAIIAGGAAAAPHARFYVRRHMDRLVENLDRGTIDLALGTFDKIPPHLTSEPLFTEDMVWVARSNHPLRGSLSADVLLSLPRVAVTTSILTDIPGAESHSGLQRRTIINPDVLLGRAAAREGKSALGAAAVYDNRTAMSAVAQSDLVAILPRRLVTVHADELGLRILDSPKSTSSVTISMIWPVSRQNDAGLLWLQQLIRGCLARTLPDARRD